jgi:hypothetical protein
VLYSRRRGGLTLSVTCSALCCCPVDPHVNKASHFHFTTAFKASAPDITTPIGQYVARDCHVQCAPTARGQSNQPARSTRCAQRGVLSASTDSRSSRSQRISHSNADLRYEEIKLTNRIHTSAFHGPTRAILTNVTCAWTTSTTSLCALIFRHEPSRNAILDCPARINFEYV